MTMTMTLTMPTAALRRLSFATLCASLSIGAALLASLPTRAADTPAPAVTATPAADRLAAARALIQQERWRDAIAALKEVNDTGSADWHNLMGYSHRKAKVPDLAAAERHYDEALRLDPKHRGALEYSGELYLMRGDLARAEQRLAELDRLCTFSCQELRDLRAAVARHKAGRS